MQSRMDNGTEIGVLGRVVGKSRRVALLSGCRDVTIDTFDCVMLLCHLCDKIPRNLTTALSGLENWLYYYCLRSGSVPHIILNS